jgi:hypothetical protein
LQLLDTDNSTAVLPLGIFFFFWEFTAGLAMRWTSIPPYAGTPGTRVGGVCANNQKQKDRA